MTDRKLFTATLVVSLVLHALLALGTRFIEVLPDIPTSARAEEPSVELVLVPDLEPPTVAGAEDPTRYTEIPDRLADERPDKADFLAMRDSRAADRLPGGQSGSQPGTEREGEFPQVTVAPENIAGAEGVSVDNPVLTPPRSRPRRQEDRRQAAEERAARGAEVGGAEGQDLLPPPTEDGAAERQEGGDETAPESGDYEDWVADQRAPSLLRKGEQQAPGDRGFDFRQLEQGSIGANVDLDGDFSLSTYEWNFAPWMRRFANDLHRSWTAPYAYRLGIIDGYTKIRLVVERDGRPSRMDVIDTSGHASLHAASVAALRTFAPYAPLPLDFPEDQLVILLGLHYPAWKR